MQVSWTAVVKLKLSQTEEQRTNISLMDSTEIAWHKAIAICKSEQFICRYYLIA